MIESNNPSAIISKNEINNALISLMKDYPYNDITVKQIIIEAKLARKTFIYKLRDKKISESNPFTKLFDGLDSDYLIALNIGAIWNVITLWVHNDFKDSLESVKHTISRYLLRLKNI